MSEKTGIEWAESTWNMIGGCTKQKKGNQPCGCDNCYALRDSWRISHNPTHPARYNGVCEKVNGVLRWTGRVNLDEEALSIPLRWRKPRRIFVASMADLFHPKVPFAFIDKVFAVMALCPQHQFMVLTKRAERMKEYFTVDRKDGAILINTKNMINAALRELGIGDFPNYHIGRSDTVKASERLMAINGWPLPNVWGMVTVEDQDHIHRIDHLLASPFVQRGVSIGPMLGPVDLGDYWRTLWSEPHPVRDLIRNRLNFVIAEGETGKDARPPHPDWIRDVRDWCQKYSVDFFFKSWGNWVAKNQLPKDVDVKATNYGLLHLDGTFHDKAVLPHHLGYESDHKVVMLKVSKKKAGRMLDGRTWNTLPE